jgi:hypothetical protein
MFNMIKSFFADNSRDHELEVLKKKLVGSEFADRGDRRAMRRVFWVGRSKSNPNEFRVGVIALNNDRKYFVNLDNLYT